MSVSEDEEIFLTQNRFSQDDSGLSSNDHNLERDICNFILDYDNNETQSEELEPLSLTQSDEELLNIPSPKQSEQRSRFHEPLPDDAVSRMQTKKFADSTMSKIKWATSLFKEWKASRNIKASDRTLNLSPINVELKDMTIDEVNFSISRFVCEVRKSDGTEYPPDTLYSLVICLQLYMETVGISYKFLNDLRFSQIRNSLDNIMKLRAKCRVPKRQAEEITIDDEETLWASGSLGSSNPKQLSNTIFYLLGLNFALRGGQEHRNLRGGPNSQFKLTQKGSKKCLVYTESSSKSNQGGLKHRSVKPKSVVAYENESCPDRCIVKLFELYMSKCPQFPKRKNEAFYLRPLSRPTVGGIWYADQAIGRHTLANVVSEICKHGGIDGYRTNHSLRATAATRLFDAGVDEQLICEVTGHRSSAVRNYKRVKEHQREKINNIVQGNTAEGQPDIKVQKLDGNVSITLNISLNK